MDRDQRREFVKDHRTCIFGYARKDAGPAMTVVYYVTDGDDILISTMEERAKVKAVERNPHVSICVLDEKWPPTYLQVFGDATIDRDPDVILDVAIRGVELMSGSKVPADLHETIREGTRAESRVVIRLRPTSTFYTPPRHTYKPEDVRGLTHTTSQSVPW
jgi:PPOX class probable F420-dependent enzyme